MSVSYSDSWNAQSFKTRPGMLSGPAALRGLTFRRDLLTSTMFNLGGSTSDEKASLVLGKVLRASNRA